MEIHSTMSFAVPSVSEVDCLWKPSASAELPAFFASQILRRHFYILDGELNAFAVAVVVLALLADVGALQGNFINVLSP